VLLNQIKAIDKERLEDRIGRFGESVMRQVDEAIKVSLGLLPL
jgi:mRNA interferase MazF